MDWRVFRELYCVRGELYRLQLPTQVDSRRIDSHYQAFQLGVVRLVFHRHRGLFELLLLARTDRGVYLSGRHSRMGLDSIYRNSLQIQMEQSRHP